jgi:hypothetical protein
MGITSEGAPAQKCLVGVANISAGELRLLPAARRRLQRICNRRAVVVLV